MPTNPLEVVRFLARSSRRVAVSVVGAVLVVAGLAMLALPGPGLVVVVVGFAILGTEYAWASSALERTKLAAEQASRVTRQGAVAVGRTASGAAGSVLKRFRRRRD